MRCEEAALTAEMGKLIGDELDIDTSSEEVTERISYAINIGYIGSSSITTQTGGNYRYTDPIFLKAGESLKIKAITPSNIGRLASCDAQGGNITRLLVGTSANPPTSASDTYENTYNATEDIYLIVGWYWDYQELELTKTYTKVTTTSKVDVVDAISDALEVNETTDTTTAPLEMTVKTGGFGGSTVGRAASFSSGYTFYRCSEDFLLKKGETLNIAVKNVATNVALLVHKEGSQYRAVIIGNASTQSETYTAPIDGYYAVTWLASTGITITKTTTRTASTSATLEELEEAAAQIPAISESVEDLVAAVFYNITDGMTTGYEDGKFIGHNGTVGSNSSFAYKEFSLKNGAVIQGSVYSHQNIAILAKKTSSGYKELVAGTGQTTESFNYTATEDMTVAVSFSLSNVRSITINTQLIASNAANIAVLFNKVNGLQMPDYGMFFDKVAVIGDSLTVGTLDGLTGGHTAGGSFNCSWLTYLAKKWGSRIRMHYGIGGSTCYSWLGSNQYGLGLMLKDSVVYDVYFVAYGHNDAGQFTIGTTSDTPTDVTVDANNDVTMETAKADTTFFGNYKKIVNEIRTKAPNAIIFLVSTDSKDSTTAGTVGYMNQYIQELAEWYYEQGDHRIFYIGYSNKLDIGGETAGYHTGGHFSTFGYAYVASIINECINEVIMDNLNTIEIKEWGKFIGSGYRTTEIDTTTSGGYLPHL